MKKIKMNKKIVSLLKSWTFLLSTVLLVCSIFGGYYFGLIVFEPDKTIEDKRVAVPVKRGDLEDKVTASGTITFPNIESLEFKVNGIVGSIGVDEGDVVQKGDILAEFNDSTIVDLNAAVVQAEKKLNDAEELLNELLAPPSELDIKNAESNLAKARLDEKQAEDTLAEYLDPPTELQIESANNDLVKAKSQEDSSTEILHKTQNPDTGLNSLESDALEDVAIAENNLLHERYILKTIESDEVEKVSQIQKDYDDTLLEYRDLLKGYFGSNLAEKYLNISPSEIESDWGVKFSDIFESNGGIPIYGSSVNQDETPWDESIVFAWVALHPTAIQTQCETSTKYTRCPESEINDQWELVDSQSDLLEQVEENKIITVKKQEDKISSLQEIYNNALDELDKTRSEMSLEEKISNLKLAAVKVKDAEKKLSELFETPDAITVADFEAKINLAKASTKDAQDTLEELYKKDEDEISLARSEIDQAQAVLNDALNDLGHSRIVAPNSGEITLISIEEGDSVQRGEPIITLVDENYAIVTANFDEIDIMALTVGDEVLVSLDSMPNQNLAGELVEIGDGVSTQGITKFPAEVEIEQPGTFELIEGLSANLSVSTLMVRNVLMVPNQAILGTFMNPTVDVFIDDESFESVSVTLGPSDEFWVVIESGLQLDDKVMMKAVSETDPFERLMGGIPRSFGSGFGPPGGGPPGGGR